MSPDGVVKIVFILIPIVFVLMLGLTLAFHVGKLKKSKESATLPQASERAAVLKKRVSSMKTTGLMKKMGMVQGADEHYALFKLDSGAKVELRIPPDEFSMLSAGDTGVLTTQGVRYIGFQAD